jgi:hypothetical protein
VRGWVLPKVHYTEHRRGAGGGRRGIGNSDRRGRIIGNPDRKNNEKKMIFLGTFFGDR